MALFVKTNYCPTADNWFRAQGRRYAWNTTPKRGDVVFFDFSGAHSSRSHVGIIEKVNADGSLTTIEGNTSVTSQDNGGAVMRRTRFKYQVTSYGRPAYASTAEMEGFLQLAAEQIGVTESPSGSNYVKYNDWYYGKSKVAEPWCAAFVSWIFLSGTKPKGTTTTTTTGGTKVTITLDTLRRGSTGAQVKALQRMLYARLGSAYKVDGEFGPTTEKGVIRVQKQLGLAADGVVGKNTWTALLTQLN